MAKSRKKKSPRVSRSKKPKKSASKKKAVKSRPKRSKPIKNGVSQALHKELVSAIKKHEKRGAVFMMQLPAEAYVESKARSIKSLIGMGFEGVYVSFQRPFHNVSHLLSHHGVDMKKLLVVDVASALHKDNHETSKRCIHIYPTVDIDELIITIYAALSKLKAKKRFIFLDSLTTITLYKHLSETSRLLEFLARSVRHHQVEDVILMFNVAKDLAHQDFIQELHIHVDEHISV